MGRGLAIAGHETDTKLRLATPAAALPVPSGEAWWPRHRAPSPPPSFTAAQATASVVSDGKSDSVTLSVLGRKEPRIEPEVCSNAGEIRGAGQLVVEAEGIMMMMVKMMSHRL